MEGTAARSELGVAIRRSAALWESLDLEYGMNRRKKQGRGGPKYAFLPPGFDLWRAADVAAAGKRATEAASFTSV